MLLVRTTLLLGCALALLAQSDSSSQSDTTSEEESTGPAILSRGQVPGAQNSVPIAFRPYIGVSGVYDTGLVPVSVASTGGIPSTDLYGEELNLGAYTYHVWKHTVLGLDYRGDFRHYNESFWDGTDNFLSLILQHRPTKRLTFTLRNEAGLYSFNNFTYAAPAGFLESNYLQLPQNDIFDNRVIFGATSADLIYQWSARLSFDLGGEGTLVRRESTALYGMTGAVARGDMEYRVSRHTTIGADYRFTYFDYTHAFGDTDIQSVGFDFSTQFSRTLQLSARIGGAHVSSSSLTDVTLSPAIAALLGESQAIQAAFHSNYVPDVEIRLSENFRHSQFSLEYLNQVTPGNGVYLTSRNNTGSFTYSYSGVRHWNFGMNASYGRMNALEQTVGAYTAYGAGAGVTRDLGKGLHAVLRFDARHYGIDTSTNFNHTEYRTSLGVNFSPGDVPLVLW